MARGQQIFFLKHQLVNIFGFVSQKGSVETTQLGCYSMAARHGGAPKTFMDTDTWISYTLHVTE